MIPKIIHYCWFGCNPKPKLVKKCIRSWKKYCPDYQIIEWNEKNFDVSSCPLYVQQAYEAKKWAFVSDYARLKIIYDNGGVYLDTDVELLKSLDPFLLCDGYFGFHDKTWIATGLGFGAVKGALVLLEMMQNYERAPFIKANGSKDMLPCPNRDTPVFIKRGLLQNDSLQTLEGNIIVYPTEYFDPYDYKAGSVRKTSNTVSMHHYSASWTIEEKKKEKWDQIIHFPQRIGRALLGNGRYEKIKRRIKKD